MSNLEVVSAFVDLRSGKTIRPGDPLPKGLDEARTRSLRVAGCLAPATAKRQIAKTKAAKGSAGASTFRGEGDPGSGAQKVAGGNGGHTRRRSQSSGGGRKTSKKSSEDDSGQ